MPTRVARLPLTPRRLGEAKRLGFRRAVVPLSTPDVAGMTLLRVADLTEALEVALESGSRVHAGV